MNILVYNAKPYDRRFLEAANGHHGHSLRFVEAHLGLETVDLVRDETAVCAFVNDNLSTPVLEALAAKGVKLIALRCAGYNNVDLTTAEKLGLTVARVPAYSPYAVAEHTLAMIMTLNRKTHRAYNRVREGNFALEGLLGFDVHGKTVGLIGTGKIGVEFAKLMRGFDVTLWGHDPYESDAAKALGLNYMPLDKMLAASDIISIHCPLTPDTFHAINDQTIGQMKHGAMLINTSRGAIVDTAAVIRGLKSGQIGALGLDVYEEEGDLFFEDLSDRVIQDDVFTRLLTFPNVLITAHQAFFTEEALANIAETTLTNASQFEKTGAVPEANAVHPAPDFCAAI